MKMTGEQRIAAPPQQVWDSLNDPEVLRASLPGCESLERLADDRFAAVVEVKVGPIGARFKGDVTLSDIEAPNAYTLNLVGNGGIAGTARGSARVRLGEDAGGTLVSYDVDAEVGGRMAQLGGPVIDATAKQLAGKFFSRFGDIVAGGKVEEAVARPAAAAAPAVAPAASAGRFPLTWVLVSVITALVGFLIGRSGDAAGSDWAGLAIGLLLVVVAGAAFEYGRRTAAPVIMLDNKLLRRLLEGERP